MGIRVSVLASALPCAFLLSTLPADAGGFEAITAASARQPCSMQSFGTGVPAGGYSLTQKRSEFFLREKTWVAVRGARGPITVHVSNPFAIDVTAPEYRDGRWLISVTPVAFGCTTVTVRDGHGGSWSAEVLTPNCEPPAASFDLVFPPEGTNVLAPDFGGVWISTFADDYLRDALADEYLRFVAADGTIVRSDPFRVTTDAPPVGSAIRTPPPSGQDHPNPYVFEYLRAATPRLSAGTTYVMQLIEYPSCLGPTLLGTYRT